MTGEYPHPDNLVKPHPDKASGHHNGMNKRPLRLIVAETVRQAMKVEKKPPWTQSDLSEKAGIAQSHVSRLLRGENVTMDVLEKVAHALGKEPFELMINNDQAKLALLGRIFGRQAPTDEETEKLLRLPKKKAHQ